jgi:YbbR domain-containing protein
MTVVSLARGIFSNIGVKLLALLVAVVIWFNAIGQQEDERLFVVPLQFASLADTLTVTGRVPHEVQIAVTGTRRDLLLIEFKKISVSLNMMRSEPGRFTQRLSVSDVILPPGVEPRKVRIVSPLLVDVTLEKIVTRRARVAVSLSGALPGGQLLSSVPEAVPEWVLVTGARSIVEHMDKVYTKPIDLSRVRDSGERDVDLDLDEATVSSEPKKVRVGLFVSVRDKRVLANIPPTVLVDEANVVAEVIPKTVSLTLEGPKTLLDQLSSRDVSVLVDLSGKPPGRYLLAPEVIVPNGIEKYIMDVDSLRVFVSRTSSPRSVREPIRR